MHILITSFSLQGSEDSDYNEDEDEEGSGEDDRPPFSLSVPRPLGQLLGNTNGGRPNLQQFLSNLIQECEKRVLI